MISLHLDTFINFDSELISPFGVKTLFLPSKKFVGCHYCLQDSENRPASGFHHPGPLSTRPPSSASSPRVSLTITRHARPLPPPPASPPTTSSSQDPTSPGAGRTAPARLSFRLAPSSQNAGVRDLPYSPAFSPAPSAPSPLSAGLHVRCASKCCSRLFAHPAHRLRPPLPCLGCVPALQPRPAPPPRLAVEIWLRTAVLPPPTPHTPLQAPPRARPPSSSPRGVSSVAPPKGLH